MDPTIYVNLGKERRCLGNVHVIEKGDTLYKIAQKYHIRVRDLLLLNPFVNVYNLQIGDELCLPPHSINEPEFTPYIVKKEDTLASILKENNLTFEKLCEINPFLKKLTLPAGTILLLPNKKAKS